MRSVYGIWDPERLSNPRDSIEKPTLVLQLYLLYCEPNGGNRKGGLHYPQKSCTTNYSWLVLEKEKNLVCVFPSKLALISKDCRLDSDSKSVHLV